MSDLPRGPVPASNAGLLPFFHEASASVHFWIEVEGRPWGASVSRATLHYFYHPLRQDEDPMDTFHCYSRQIEAAVRRRVASGAREPVMLREFDLREVS